MVVSYGDTVYNGIRIECINHILLKAIYYSEYIRKSLLKKSHLVKLYEQNT